MFLLPPVPGVPVYLAGGIIIVNACWKVHTSFYCIHLRTTRIHLTCLPTYQATY
jgi:hypothetical protein